MTTLNLQVGTSPDDAEENNVGTIDLTSAGIDMSGQAWWAGMRFLNVTVPSGSTINTGTLQVYVFDTGQDNAYFDAYCEDEDNPGTFTSAGSNISGRTPTTAKATQGASNVGVGWYSTTITAAVAEVVARGGWASGQAMVVLLDALASCFFRFRSWDGDNTEAAKLDIDYTAAGGAGRLTNSIRLKTFVHGALTG